MTTIQYSIFVILKCSSFLTHHRNPLLIIEAFRMTQWIDWSVLYSTSSLTRRSVQLRADKSAPSQSRHSVIYCILAERVAESRYKSYPNSPENDISRPQNSPPLHITSLRLQRPNSNRSTPEIHPLSLPEHQHRFFTAIIS